MTTPAFGTTSHSRGERGFSLAELMVASTVFVIVALAAYAIYEAGQKAYRRGDEAADQQQQTRVAFDEMVGEIRLAGFDFNLDGNQTPYLDASDEQVEYSSETAITFRANFDYGDAAGGREYGDTDGDTVPDETPCDAGNHSGYESCADWVNDQMEAGATSDIGLPIVTTSNDEIVTYALKSTDSSANTGNIDLKLDLSVYRNGVIKDGIIYNEELAGSSPSARVSGVDLTNANPPYTLYRFHFDQNGNPVGVPIADNIKSLKFTYFGQDGRDYWCPKTESDGSCLAANRVYFKDALGQDSTSGTNNYRRLARAAIRRVNIELVGLTARQDFLYTDPFYDSGSPGPGDTKTKRFRKFKLLADVTPINLGKTGQLDLGALPPSKVEDVRLCVGQCNSIYISWKANKVEENILGYVVKVFDSSDSQIASAFGGTLDQKTGRVYMTVSSYNDPDIKNGTEVHITVYAKNVNGANGPESDPSLDRTIVDEMRSEAPKKLVATGYDPATYWDNTTDNGRPTSNDTNTKKPTATGTYAALEHKIKLTWLAPTFVLDVTNTSDPANSQTTRVTDNTYAPYVGDTDPLCERFGPFDKNGNGTANDYRVLEHESFGLWHKGAGSTTPSWLPPDQRRGKYLIFRSENPKFEPKDSDLIAIVSTESYEDRSAHVYSYPCTTCGTGEEQQGVFQHTDRSLENCRVYYYRVRMADDCWDGTKPAGVNPGAGDFTHEHLSPFFPPVDHGNSDNTDICNPCVGSGDNASEATMGYAIPGKGSYPPASGAEAARPEKPKNLNADKVSAGKYLFRFDASKRGSNLGSGNSYADGYPSGTSKYPHITISKYRVFQSTDVNRTQGVFPVPITCDGNDGTACNAQVKLWAKIVVRPDQVKEYTIWSDDENDDGTINYGQAAGAIEDETGYYDSGSGSWKSRLEISVPSPASGPPYPAPFNNQGKQGYEIVATQCRKGQDSDPIWDDTIDTLQYDYSQPSDPLYLPCAYGEWERYWNGSAWDWKAESSGADGEITLNDSGWPDWVELNASDTDGDHKPCRARLVLTSLSKGNRAYTPWKNTTDRGDVCGSATQGPAGPYAWTFDKAEIDAALADLEGEDVLITAQVQERSTSHCIGETSEAVKKYASSCIRLLGSEFNDTDFTDNTAAWVPDNEPDCFQAEEWVIKESCGSGGLTIKQIKVTVGNESSNSTGLVRVYWDWDTLKDGDPDTNPILIYDKDAPTGNTGNVTFNLTPPLTLEALQSLRMRFEFSNGSDNLSMKDNNLEVEFTADRVAPDGATSNNEKYLLQLFQPAPAEPTTPCP